MAKVADWSSHRAPPYREVLFMKSTLLKRGGGGRGGSNSVSKCNSEYKARVIWSTIRVRVRTAHMVEVTALVYGQAVAARVVGRGLGLGFQEAAILKGILELGVRVGGIDDGKVSEHFAPS